jgi:hypothetical protein
MRRLACATIAAAAGAVIAPGAFGLPVGGDWNGAVRGDAYPDSSVQFDVVRGATGNRRVVNVLLAGLDYTCDEGAPDDTSLVSLTRGFRVHRDRTFGGRADAVIQGFDPPARFTGKLRRHGRASGTIRVHGELDPEGHPGANCDTGRQEWTAKKAPPPDRRG